MKNWYIYIILSWLTRIANIKRRVVATWLHFDKRRVDVVVPEANRWLVDGASRKRWRVRSDSGTGYDFVKGRFQNFEVPRFHNVFYGVVLKTSHSHMLLDELVGLGGAIFGGLHCRGVQQRVGRCWGRVGKASGFYNGVEEVLVVGW